jgi:hypothetical protein
MYVYYIDGEQFKTKYYSKIPFINVSSLNENTPAYESLTDYYKEWCKKGRIWHRLTGPARIFSNGREEFYLNDKKYKTVKEWINDHPNLDLYFDALGMNETDRVLWFLQN